MATDRAHPDQTWVGPLVTALNEWLADESTSPTSQISGGGAFQAAEKEFSAIHGGRPSLMVQSATYGMRSTLAALGVVLGDQVLVPSLDWPSSYAAVRSLGAVPVPIAVHQETLTMDPAEIGRSRTKRTKAVVVCHLHGVPADVPAIRNALGDDLPVVEDAAQALGSTLDGALVGLLGVAGVFSFGPQKPVDVREGGMILARDWDLWTAALQQTGHPVRQLTGGIDVPDMGNLSLRPHPVSAILLATYLRNWDPEQARLDHQQLADELAALPGIRVLGRDPRRRNATHTVPVMIQPGHEPALDCYRAVPSGARDIAALDAGLHTECEVYLVSRRDPATEHRVNCAD